MPVAIVAGLTIHAFWVFWRMALRAKYGHYGEGIPHFTVIDVSLTLGSQGKGS